MPRSVSPKHLEALLEGRRRDEVEAAYHNYTNAEAVQLLDLRNTDELYVLVEHYKVEYKNLKLALALRGGTRDTAGKRPYSRQSYEREVQPVPPPARPKRRAYAIDESFFGELADAVADRVLRRLRRGLDLEIRARDCGAYDVEL